MAGGPHARFVLCFDCQRTGQPAFAERFYEGSEDDRYRCAAGHTFGVHWRQLPERPPDVLPGDVAALTEARRRAHERVAIGAYYRYLEREKAGRVGDQLGDWLAAECALACLGRRPGARRGAISNAAVCSTLLIYHFDGARGGPRCRYWLWNPARRRRRPEPMRNRALLVLVLVAAAANCGGDDSDQASADAATGGGSAAAGAAGCSRAISTTTATSIS